MPEKAVRLQGRDLNMIVNIGENHISPRILNPYLCLEPGHVKAIRHFFDHDHSAFE